MKQTVAVLAVTLAVLLAVTGLIVSANLRQAEMIVEKTAHENELLEELNLLTAAGEKWKKQAETTRKTLDGLRRERDELRLELDASVQTIRAANDAILHLEGEAKQTEAEIEQARADGEAAQHELNAQLQSALAANEALMGELNAATLQAGEQRCRAESVLAELTAVRNETQAFAELLAMLDELPGNTAFHGFAPQATAAQVSASQALPLSAKALPLSAKALAPSQQVLAPAPQALAARALTASAERYQADYPHSVLRLPDALLDSLRMQSAENENRRDPPGLESAAD